MILGKKSEISIFSLATEPKPAKSPFLMCYTTYMPPMPTFIPSMCCIGECVVSLLMSSNTAPVYCSYKDTRSDEIWTSCSVIQRWTTKHFVKSPSHLWSEQGKVLHSTGSHLWGIMAKWGWTGQSVIVRNVQNLEWGITFFSIFWFLSISICGITLE